jgi:hypothetical protein
MGMPDPEFASSGHAWVADRLWEQTGLRAADMDVALLYDHFSPMVLMQLEDYGFCAKGEGNDYVLAGKVRYDRGAGVNGGVQDAFNLSDKLVEILTSSASPDLLDRYERQRRAVAIEYINANTARNKKNIEERDPDARRKTQSELRIIAANPIAAKDYLRKTSMIDALERAESIA